MKLEKITFCPDGDEPVDFYVLEQTKIAGVNYILVTDFEDGDGEALILTLTEYKILSKLLSSRSILTRSALLESLWDADSRFIDDNTLSVHVSRLREKVGAGHIKTVRGVGYQWVD